MIQRRLVEGNQRRLQGESPLLHALIRGHDSSRTSVTQVPALLVNCKVRCLSGGRFPLLRPSHACRACSLHKLSLLLWLSGDGEKAGLSLSGPACTFLSCLSPLCTAPVVLCPRDFTKLHLNVHFLFCAIHVGKVRMFTEGSHSKVKKNLRLCMCVMSCACVCVCVRAVARSCCILWS